MGGRIGRIGEFLFFASPTRIPFTHATKAVVNQINLTNSTLRGSCVQKTIEICGRANCSKAEIYIYNYIN